MEMGTLWTEIVESLTKKQNFFSSGMGILCFLPWILHIFHLKAKFTQAISNLPTLTLAPIMFFNNFLLPNEKFPRFQKGTQSLLKLDHFLNDLTSYSSFSHTLPTSSTCCFLNMPCIFSSSPFLVLSPDRLVPSHFLIYPDVSLSKSNTHLFSDFFFLVSFN